MGKRAHHEEEKQDFGKKGFWDLTKDGLSWFTPFLPKASLVNYYNPTNMTNGLLQQILPRIASLPWSSTLSANFWIISGQRNEPQRTDRREQWLARWCSEPGKVGPGLRFSTALQEKMGSKRPENSIFMLQFAHFGVWGVKGEEWREELSY